jgi:succinoglycan biosynthesis transport protein ExoP
MDIGRAGRGYHHTSPLEGLALHTTEPTVAEQSDLREFLGLLRRHALLIVVVTLATAVAALVASLMQAKQYEASATLLYTPTTAAATGMPDTATQMQTIAGIATSTTVLSPIAERHGLTLRQIKHDVSAGLSTGTTSASQLLTITAKSRHAQAAAAIANDVASSLQGYRSSREKGLLNSQVSFLQQQLRALNGKTDPSSIAAASDVRTQLVQLLSELAVFSPDLTVLNPATAPASASSPKPIRNAAIGLLVGLVLAIMLAVLRDRLDRRTRSIEEVESLYRTHLLGLVPFTRRRLSRPELLADFSGSRALADAYRTIRTNLSLFQLGKATKSTIIVTSAVPEEGKSAVAANLALALSAAGKRVLAVSADLHDPALHEYFANRLPGTGPQPLLQRSEVLRATLKQATAPTGLLEVLAGDVDLDDGPTPVTLSVIERARGGSLDLLANGSTFFDPAALLGSNQMKHFLQAARQLYDVIVIDSPPLLVNADTVVLAQEANVVVVVARLKHLTRNQARRAVRVMSAAHIAPTGLIVTGEVEATEPGYGYGYGYRSEGEEAASEQPVRGPAGNGTVTSDATKRDKPAQSSI